MAYLFARKIYQLQLIANDQKTIFNLFSAKV